MNNTKFSDLFSSYGHPQEKVLKGQELSGMGCQKIFRVKGQKSHLKKLE